MDVYGDYLHELACDIYADRNSYTILIDVGGVELHIPTSDTDKVVDYLRGLGVGVQKKFMHTVIIQSYPEGFSFEEKDAIKMAKELAM